LALGERLRASGIEATSVLRRVQKEHPDDFWANLVLGNALLFRAPAEARGYYRTALGSRPAASVGYCAVGDTLRLQGVVDEAVHYYNRSLQLDPQYARGYTNLGLALQTQGKLNDAIANYRKSLDIDPDYTWSYFNLGNALRDNGQLDEAMAQYQKAMSLDPGNPSVLGGIRIIRVRQGHAPEVWEEWRQIIRAEPLKQEDWWGYAELSLFLGKEDEYRRVRQALLRHFGDSDDPMITEKVARTCLMLPPDSADELRKACVLADRAVAAMKSTDDWLHPYFLFAKALAEYRQGHLDNALTILQGEASKALSPAPRLLMAMVYQAQGNPEAARTTLTAAVKSFDWRPSRADSRDVWMRHILRREAEGMILADPAKLETPSAQAKPVQQ
jgi:eukaryotic-like serine/threonine-protein kinase